MPRNTQTIIQDGNNNRTATHLSTNIIILVNGNTVGAVQTLQITESREIKMIDELGTDGHIDSAPTKSAVVTGSCSRIRWDRMRIAPAFSRGWIHVKSQRIPFDIEVQDRFHDVDTANAIVTVLKNVWVKQISYTYDANNFIITENMDFEAEDIYSVIKTNQNVVKGPGNGMNFDVYLNQFEQEADKGDYRGALDAPGLISALVTDPTL